MPESIYEIYTVQQVLSAVFNILSNVIDSDHRKYLHLEMSTREMVLGLEFVSNELRRV